MPWIGSTSIPGMLPAARPKFGSISLPPMMSALATPSPANCAARPLVLASFAARSSTTTIASAFALAESACFSASARTFFGRSIVVVAHDRPESLAAAAELRRRLVAVAGAAGALLAIHLLRRRLDLAARLGLVVARLPLGELPAHHAVQDVRPRLQPEDGVGERHRARSPRRRAILTLSSITLLRRIRPQPALRPWRRRARGSRPASARRPAASASPRRARGSSRPSRPAPRRAPG